MICRAVSNNNVAKLDDTQAIIYCMEKGIV